MEEEVYKLESFLTLYLTEEGNFTIDMVHLVNLISSHIPELVWNIDVWERTLREIDPLPNVVLLFENDEFREIKFREIELTELGIILDSVKICSNNITKKLRRHYSYKSCEYGKIKIVKYFHSTNVDLGEDCLRIASEKGHLEVVKYICEETHLVVYDTTLGFVVGYDHQSLLRAVIFGRLEVVKYFYSQNYDLAILDNKVIIWASYYGHLEVVKYLHKEVGCDPTVEHNKIIIWASHNGHLEVVKYLYEVAGCDPTDIDNCSIRWASCNGHLEVVKYLHKEAGCDPTAANNWALFLARQNRHLEVVKYLEDTCCNSPFYPLKITSHFKKIVGEIFTFISNFSFL